MQVYPQYLDDKQEQLQETSTVLRIQNLQLALEKAVENISLLQSNLSYVIGAKEDLEAELLIREKRQQALRKEFERELARKDREIQALRQNQQDLASLLQDAKQQMQMAEAAARQRQDQARRCQRKLEEQKATILAMEEQIAAIRYSSDLSYNNLTQDNLRLQELETQNEQLKYELQKVKLQQERQVSRARRFEKEVQTFKNWLGSVVGVRKVVEGCEGMLMDQITSRLNSCSRH